MPSELNNADYASRFDDKSSHDKQLVEFVAESWLKLTETNPAPRSWPEERPGSPPRSPKLWPEASRAQAGAKEREDLLPPQ